MKKMKCYSLVASVLFVVSHISHAASHQIPKILEDNLQARKEIAQSCLNAYESRNYNTLEKLLNQYNTSEIQDKNGFFLAEICLDGITYSFQKYSEDLKYGNSALVQMSEYELKYPKSEWPYVISAIWLEDKAWAWRGNGYISSLDDESINNFLKYQKQAISALDSSPQLAHNMLWYNERISIESTSAIKNKEMFIKYLKEGTEKYPEFISLYVTAANGMKPQWGGSWKLIDNLGDYAAIQTRKTKKDSYYARYYSDIVEPCCARNIMQANEYDINRINNSVNQLLEQYPTNTNYQKMGYLLCMLDEKEKGQKLFDMASIKKEDIAESYKSCWIKK